MTSIYCGSSTSVGAMKGVWYSSRLSTSAVHNKKRKKSRGPLRRKKNTKTEVHSNLRCNLDPGTLKIGHSVLLVGVGGWGGGVGGWWEIMSFSKRKR